jgi:internalin A
MKEVASIFFTLLVGASLFSCGQRQPLAVYTPIADLQFADSELGVCVAQTAAEHEWPDAGHVNSLRCNNSYGSEISKLDGIENLVNLERLDVAHNGITDTTSLAHLGQLNFIDMSHNTIETFGPLGTRRVTYLNLDHNRIMQVDWLDFFNSLESLSLSHNRIENVAALTDKTTLRELDLSANRLTSVAALSKLTSLRHLDLSRNRLSQIPALGALTSLETLAISSNPGIDIAPLSALTKLSELDLDDDELTDVAPLGALTELKRLSLRGNRLTSIAPLFELGGLTHIDLTDNPDLACTELERLVQDFGADVVQYSACSSQTGN